MVDFPVERSLYVHFRGLYNAKGQMSVSELTDSIKFKLSTGEFDRVILDLRFGGGGSGDHMGPLVDFCRDFSTKRQLIALIGNFTRGTLLEFASLLENNSPVVFIGQQTSAGPNSVADPGIRVLPNSGIEVAITKTH